MRARTLIAALSTALAAAACSFDPSGAAPGGGGGGDGGPLPDAPPGTPDGGGPDGATPAPTHLLLSEVRAVTSGGDSEFLEIYNPTGAEVALDTYYLADDDEYFRLPEAVADGDPLPLDPLNDFVARFPAGTTIPAGGVLVIAFDEAGFDGEFGALPDLALGLGTVPLMEVVAGGDAPTLTDTGEGIVLFRWDGATDLVTDVDMVLAGEAPTSTNLLADKSGQSIDGPDDGGSSSTYQDDAATILPTAKRTKASESYKRILLESPHEIVAGGNGVGGHDETSENTRVTWSQTGFGAPTPGQVPAALVP